MASPKVAFDTVRTLNVFSGMPLWKVHETYISLDLSSNHGRGLVHVLPWSARSVIAGPGLGVKADGRTSVSFPLLGELLVSASFIPYTLPLLIAYLPDQPWCLRHYNTSSLTWCLPLSSRYSAATSARAFHLFKALADEVTPSASMRWNEKFMNWPFFCQGHSWDERSSADVPTNLSL